MWWSSITPVLRKLVVGIPVQFGAMALVHRMDGDGWDGTMGK